jgi:hypothetical protein
MDSVSSWPGTSIQNQAYTTETVRSVLGYPSFELRIVASGLEKTVTLEKIRPYKRTAECWLLFFTTMSSRIFMTLLPQQ